MAQSNPTWEYRFEHAIPIEKLQELGEQGWELAGVDDRSSTKFIFKRPALTFVERITLEQRATYYASLGLVEENSR